MERRTHVLSPLGLTMVALVASAALLAGCAERGAPLTTASGAPITTASRFDKLRFSHETHLKKEIGCLDCHSGVDQAEDLSSTYMPFHDKCARCHSDTEMKNCKQCHLEEDTSKIVRAVPADDGIHFSHVNHARRVMGNCAKCHPEVPRAKTSEESVRPPMETCTDGCHKEDMAESRCDRCHADLTRYSLESVRFMAHGARFVENHGEAASKSDAACSNCHARDFCSDCHSNTNLVGAETRLADRATRSFIHPAPYQAVHAMDARSKRDTCETCHRSNFCDSCHASVGLASLDRVRTAPHPPGWSDPSSTTFHGLQARREITACAACHDQGAASVCVRCHQVGGTGGNPHPPGFSRRESEDPTTNRMCRACHWR
ncbi:cytochrome c3 family protein [Myxococcota bacterium]|nr:cytochrome c3 family protein [Myxococcota bacterium]